MKVRDIPDVYQIECACFRSPWSKLSLLSEMRNSIAHYFVGEIKNEIVAYGGMWVLYDEAHITNIAVLQEHRGKGIAKALMLELMRCAVKSGASKMTLEVRETNSIAQNLYCKFDFYQNGFRPRYYEDTGEGAIIMWNDSIQKTLEKNSISNG